MDIKIKITNFKSIQSAELIVGNKINYLIGKNESGKSNIIEAIKFLDDSRKNNNFSEIYNKNLNFNSKKDDKKLIIKLQYQYYLDQDLNKKWNIFLSEKTPLFRKVFKIEMGNSLMEFNTFPKMPKTFDCHIKPEDFNFYIFKYLKKLFEKKHFNKSRENYKELNDFKNNFFQSNIIHKFYEKNNLPELFQLKELIVESKKKIEEFKRKNVLKDDVVFLFYSEITSWLLNGQIEFSQAKEDFFFLSLWKIFKRNVKELEKLIFLKRHSSEDFYDYKEELQKELNEFSKKIPNLFKKNWLQDTVTFKIFIENDFFRIVFADIFDQKNSFFQKKEKGKYRSLKIRSSGLKQFLSIFLFFSESNIQSNSNINRKHIILFDEPDLHLHAQAVCDLKQVLEKLVQKNSNFSIIIATHNPYFIDEDNVNDFCLVTKTKEGTQINSKLVSSSGKESNTTLAPFIYQLGIDRKSFLELNNSISIFVEGYHDMLLLSGMKYYFGKEYNTFLFIPLGGAAKNSSLINLVTTFSKSKPYFIYDYDQEGKRALNKIKKTTFYNQEKPNAFFINLAEEYNSDSVKKNTKIETQNLFNDEVFENIEIAKNKNSSYYFQVWKALKNQKIKLSETTKTNFQKIFEKIKSLHKDWE